MSSQVWSVTSYTQLGPRGAGPARAGTCCTPTAEPRRSYLEQVLAGEQGVFVAASDYVRAVAEQVRPWIPGDYCTLGCDGMGRSETREALRRHFEVDAECDRDRGAAPAAATRRCQGGNGRQGHPGSGLRSEKDPCG